VTSHSQLFDKLDQKLPQEFAQKREKLLSTLKQAA
jgi:hypothetical protein